MSSPSSSSSSTSADDVTRVLFVGNSFTFVNDLPGLFTKVAASFGKTVVVDNSTIGGCTLYEQAPSRDARTKQLFAESWDFIVLQDYSMLPTVLKARDVYLFPAVTEMVGEKKSAKIILYQTWGYYNGSTSSCPTSDNPPCFPLGTLADLTTPSCSTNPSWFNSVDSFDCMSYSLARGYLSAFTDLPGVDLLAPCGISWQVP